MAEVMDYAYVLIVDEGHLRGRSQEDTDALLWAGWRQQNVSVENDAGLRDFMGISMDDLLAAAAADTNADVD